MNDDLNTRQNTLEEAELLRDLCHELVMGTLRAVPDLSTLVAQAPSSMAAYMIAAARAAAAIRARERIQAGADGQRAADGRLRSDLNDACLTMNAAMDAMREADLDADHAYAWLEPDTDSPFIYLEPEQKLAQLVAALNIIKDVTDRGHFQKALQIARDVHDALAAPDWDGAAVVRMLKLFIHTHTLNQAIEPLITGQRPFARTDNDEDEPIRIDAADEPE